MSNGKLTQIHQREIEQRRRSTLWLLALVFAIVVVISSLVTVLR